MMLAFLNNQGGKKTRQPLSLYKLINDHNSWYMTRRLMVWRKVDEHDNNNENFICVFECTIVSLATYRQFTNAAWDWIIYKKRKTKNKKQKAKKTKTKTKQKPEKNIKIALSLGYPSSYFYNKRYNMLL